MASLDGTFVIAPPPSIRKTAYISLVRSTLEYGATIWEAFLQSNITKMEKIQGKATRFITGDDKTQSPGSVNNMLKSLERRKELRLTFLFKVVEGQLPAIPPDNYLVPATNKRRIRATEFSDFQSQNTVRQQSVFCVTSMQHSHQEELFVYSNSRKLEGTGRTPSAKKDCGRL